MGVCLHILAVLLLAAGFVGCVVPVVPGVWLAFSAVLACFLGGDALSPSSLVAAGAFALVATVLDFAAPLLGARRFKCSRYGTWGCLAGTLAGLLFLPWGLLAGPFAGAFLAECIFARKSVKDAARGGAGALVGFLFGVAVKLAACGAMALWVARSLVRVCLPAGP